jgi:hypothetical protein
MRLAARGRRAEMDAPDAAERVAQFRFCNGAGGVVRGAVAASLYDHDGLVLAAELADIIDPKAKRPMAEQHARRDGIARLERCSPDQRENRVVAQEQGMRAVVDVLTAEIPDMQRDRSLSLAAR